MKTVYIVLGVVAVLILGTALVAEKSLPNSALYPVKVGFNEMLATAFISGVEEKARREISLADRRLEEAERLAENEGLTERARKRIEKQFGEHAANATEHINSLMQEGNSQAALFFALQFQSVLTEHEVALSKLIGAPVATSTQSAAATTTATTSPAR